MARTMPQIVMLNHAASTNYKRMEARSKATSEGNKQRDETDPIAYKGKRLSQLTDDEMSAYYASN